MFVESSGKEVRNFSAHYIIVEIRRCGQLTSSEGVGQTECGLSSYLKNR